MRTRKITSLIIQIEESFEGFLSHRQSKCIEEREEEEPKEEEEEGRKKEEIDRSTIFRFSLFDKRTIDLISIMNREHRRRAFLRFLIPITLELALTTQSQFRFTKLR